MRKNKRPKTIKEMNTLSSKTKKSVIVLAVIVLALLSAFGVYKAYTSSQKVKEIKTEEVQNFIRYTDITQLLADSEKYADGIVRTYSIGATNIYQDKLFDNSSISGYNKAIAIYIPTKEGTIRSVYYKDTNEIKSSQIIPSKSIKDWEDWDKAQADYALNRTEKNSKKLENFGNKFNN